jgi:hypothetical protein
MAMTRLNGGTEFDTLKRLYPDDHYLASLVLKAASSPATLAADAGLLGHSIVSDLLTTLSSTSAGAQVLQSGLSLQFDTNAAIIVPALQASASQASFVGEAAPIPVRNLLTSSTTLTPRKLAVACVLSREMLDHSKAEAAVTDTLSRAIGLSIDACLFDAQPADTIRPAGLRSGVAAMTSTTSMAGDLAALTGAVAAIGGPVLVIASPARAMLINLALPRAPPFPVLGSSAIAANDLIAIAAHGVASAVDATPSVEISHVTAMHMDDVPLPLASVGTPNTMAAPSRSLFQSDSVGLKVRFNADWARRSPQAVAWLTVSGW